MLRTTNSQKRKLILAGCGQTGEIRRSAPAASESLIGIFGVRPAINPSPYRPISISDQLISSISAILLHLVVTESSNSHLLLSLEEYGTEVRSCGYQWHCCYSCRCYVSLIKPMSSMFD